MKAKRRRQATSAGNAHTALMSQRITEEHDHGNEEDHQEDRREEAHDQDGERCRACTRKARAGGAASVKSDTQTTSITLRNARHLRRYYVAGKQGDGSTVDLAVRGLDTSSPSVTAPLIGASTLVGVRRVFDVAAEAAASFGVPQ